jgi:hypothetical protein
MLPQEKMSEAEVSLRLALYLLRNDIVTSNISVAIDGAQIRTKDKFHFPLADFLKDNGLKRCQTGPGWYGSYSLGSTFSIVIHSNPGQGDVVANVRSGHVLRVEAKKGTLSRSRSSSEYQLLREAFGQLMTIETDIENNLLAVAVPKSNKFDELARNVKTGRWC